MKIGKEIEFQIKKKFKKVKVLKGVNLSMTSPLIDGVVKDSILRGDYESDEYILLSNLLEPNDRFLEIGGCLGFFI